jgi:hypothetical protein
MKITHYFLHFGYATRPKNKIQADFEHYLKGISSKIIPAFEVPELKKQMEGKLKELNAKHHRCSEMKIYFYDALDNGSISIQGTNVDFAIRPASLSNVQSFKN